MEDFIIRGTYLTEYIGKGGDIVIPDGVTEIGAEVFSTLQSDNKVSFDIRNTITSVHIPKTVTSIKQAFMDCKNLKNVTFDVEANIDVIPYMAFYGCKSLKEFEVPKSVKSISRLAFGECNNVKLILHKNCKVNNEVFGYGEHNSGIVIPDDYLFMDTLDKSLLINNLNQFDNTSNKTKQTEQRHLGVFKTSANEALDQKIKIRKIIGFILLILYIGTLALSSVYIWGILLSIIIIILGIINIALIISDKGKYYK